MFKLYFKHTLIAEDLTIEPLNNFGFIENKKILYFINRILLKNDDISLITLRDENLILKIIRILNSIIYITVKNPNKDELSYQFIEYNPDLNIISSDHTFWETLEIEYKITITDRDKVKFKELFLSNFNGVSNRFHFGPLKEDITYERYVGLSCKDVETYFVILGKKNWKRKMAIKYKILDVGSILSRKVNICEYNDHNYHNTITKLTNTRNTKDLHTTKFPPFYKHKFRYIVIDSLNGYVYGFSYSEAITQNKAKHTFNQIEIEFWSAIREKSDVSAIYDQPFYESFHSLIDLCKNYLETNFIQYCIPGGTKYEWIKSL